MTNEEYTIRKRLIKTGGSYYLIVPAVWLKEQEKRLNQKVCNSMDLTIGDDNIVIRPTKKA